MLVHSNVHLWRLTLKRKLQKLDFFKNENSIETFFFISSYIMFMYKYVCVFVCSGCSAGVGKLQPGKSSG